MDELRIEGKAFAVFSTLTKFAEQNKGKTVAEAIRKEILERAEAEQFGMTVEAFRECLK